MTQQQPRFQVRDHVVFYRDGYMIDGEGNRERVPIRNPDLWGWRYLRTLFRAGVRGFRKGYRR